MKYYILCFPSQNFSSLQVYIGYTLFFRSFKVLSLWWFCSFQLSTSGVYVLFSELLMRCCVFSWLIYLISLSYASSTSKLESIQYLNFRVDIQTKVNFDQWSWKGLNIFLSCCKNLLGSHLKLHISNSQVLFKVINQLNISLNNFCENKFYNWVFCYFGFWNTLFPKIPAFLISLIRDKTNKLNSGFAVQVLF